MCQGERSKVVKMDGPLEIESSLTVILAQYWVP